MKKSGPTKNLPEERGKSGILNTIRMYFSAIVLVHKNLGALRIVAAYFFLIFAVCSLLFTIRVPVTSDFLPPTAGAKAKSRAISGIMVVINILAHSVVLNWRRSSSIPMFIRIAFIVLVFYLDTFLVRIIYILIRDGSFL
jgi:hypothetical protein